jgi:hypothetical protein
MAMSWTTGRRGGHSMLRAHTVAAALAPCWLLVRSFCGAGLLIAVGCPEVNNLLITTREGLTSAR